MDSKCHVDNSLCDVAILYCHILPKHLQSPNLRALVFLLFISDIGDVISYCNLLFAEDFKIFR